MKSAAACILFFLHSLAIAQPGQYRFQLYSTDQGLASAEIYAVLQDRAGYLWIGTTNGLHRFDGYSFSIFRHIPFDSTSLSANFIFSLCEDTQGDLWLAAAGEGLNTLNVRTGRARRFIHRSDDPSTISSNELTRVFCDRQGNIWAGSVTGTIDVIRRGARIASRVPAEQLRPFAYIRSFVQDDADRIWVASTNRICTIDGALHVQEIPFTSLPPLHTPPFHTVLYCDSSHAMWLGSSGKLWKYDAAENIFHSVEFVPKGYSAPIRSITAIKEESSGIFWITTDGGIFRDDHRSHATTVITDEQNFPPVLRTILPRTLTIDRTGLIWIGFGVYGMVSIRTLDHHILTFQARPGVRDGLPDRYVRGLAEDSRNNLWIGTYKGITRLDSSLTHFTQFTSILHTQAGKAIEQIDALYVDSANTLWIGTNTDGLFAYDLTRKTMRHLLGTHSVVNDPRDNGIASIMQDRTSRFWLTTGEGGVVVLAADGTFLRRFDKTSIPALPHNLTRSTLQDREGRIWIGTFGGLCLLNRSEDSLTVYTTDDKNPATLSNPKVLALFEDSRGKICIGTSGGLNIFDPVKKTFRSYLASKGFVNDIVVGITEDASGFLWVSTYGGLLSLDREGNIRKTLYEADGLQNNLFNTEATLKLHSGKIAFGGAYGMSIISPTTIVSNNFIPPVVIQAYKQSDASAARAVSSQETGSVTLEPDESSIRFEFAALDFRFSPGNIYSYKMDGLDKEWTTTATHHNVTYTNIPGGEYVFKVKAAGRDGLWNEQAASIVVTVHPPIWRRWWFVPALILLFFALVSGLVTMRMRQRFALEKIRVSIAADLHDEIGSALARIANLADILVMKQTFKLERKRKESPADDIIPAANPQKIADVSRELLEKMSDVVWSVNPANDDLDKLLARIQTYSTEIAETHELAIDYRLAGSTVRKRVDPQVSRATLLIVKEAITNILVHARAHNIALHIVVNDHFLAIHLADDGIGFVEAELPRINGIYNMRKRAETSGGSFSLSSICGKGTQIDFTLPL